MPRFLPLKMGFDFRNKKVVQKESYLFQDNPNPVIKISLICKITASSVY